MKSASHFASDPTHAPDASAALDALPQCVVIATPIRNEQGLVTDGRVDFMNRAARGCVRDRGVSGTTVLEILPGGLARTLVDAMCDVIETGRPVSYREVSTDLPGNGDLGELSLRVCRHGDGIIATWEMLTTNEGVRAGEGMGEPDGVVDVMSTVPAPEARLLSLIDAIPVMLWLSGRSSEGVSFNRAWVEFTGAPLEAHLGDGWLEFVHPDDRKRLLEICQGAFERRESFTAEFRLKRADGTYRCVLETGTPRYDEDGAFAGFIGSCVDIQDQRAAQRAIARGEERYRAIVDSQSEMICRFRPDGSILFANSAYARARGTTPEALESSNFWDWIDAEDRADVRAQLDQLTPDAPEITIENRFETREGMRWTRWTNRGLAFDEEGRATEVQSSGVDITDRKQAERMRATLAAIVESTNDAVISKTLDGTITSWNGGAERLFGYSAEEAIGRPITMIIPEELRPQEEKILERLRRGERIEHFETVRLARDGRRIDISLTISPIRDGKGRVVGASKVSRDITRRKAAERALKAREAELELIAKTTPVMFARCGRDLRYRFMNRAAASLFGMQPEEVVGRRIEELLGPEGFAILRPHIDRVLAGEPVEFDAEIPFPALGPRWMRVSYMPDYDENDEIAGWVVSTIDVTVRKRAEIALRKSESRFRTVANATPAIVWAAHPNGEIFYLNSRWEEFTGQPVEAGLGAGWLDCIHPDERAILADKWARATADGHGYEGESRYRRADGEYRRHYFKAIPVLDEDGEPQSWYGTSVDIEDRKRAEEALRESEERFQNVADSSPVMMWVVRPDGHCTYLNKRWYEFTGQTEDEAIGFGWLDCVHPDDFRATRQVFFDALQHRQPFRIEYRLRRNDGDYRWCIDAATPRFSETGEFLGFVGSVFDISDRKDVEDALRESEERFRTLADNMSQLAWMADANGWLFWYNKRWYDYTGTTLEEMKGWGWKKVHHPDYVDGVVERLQHSWDTGEPWEDLFPMRGRDGEYRWFLSRAQPIRDENGDVVRWFGTNTDVTEHREVEQALRDSEHRLRLAMRGAHAGAWSLEVATGRMHWSDELLELYGFDGTTPVCYERWAESLHPDEREAVERSFHEKVASDDPEFRLEFRIVHPEKGDRWIFALGRIERNTRGEAVRIDGINIDITERKRHEERMRTVMAELNHRVKNTLAVVQTIAGQTLRGAESLEAFQTSFERRLRSIASAHNLLTKSDWEGAALEEIVETEVDASVVDVGRRSIDGPVIVLPPKAALAVHMVVHELTTNACKYGALSESEGRIDVRWSIDGDRQVVIDWSERASGEIGEPKTIGYGSRLMKQLVEYELGGTLDRSFAPTGLHCRIVFPLDPTSEARRPAPAVAGGPVGDSVLVVEDNATLAMGLCEELTSEGYAVLGPASNLDEAFELAERESVGAVLLDVDLAGRPSYALARSLDARGVPYALLTGYNKTDLPADLQHAEVLSKPLSMMKLYRFLQSHEIATG